MEDDVFQKNREFFYKIARENTRRNQYGYMTFLQRGALSAMNVLTGEIWQSTRQGKC